jgi:hypothetical protein
MCGSLDLMETADVRKKERMMEEKNAFFCALDYLWPGK